MANEMRNIMPRSLSSALVVAREQHDRLRAVRTGEAASPCWARFKAGCHTLNCQLFEAHGVTHRRLAS